MLARAVEWLRNLIVPSCVCGWKDSAAACRGIHLVQVALLEGCRVRCRLSSEWEPDTRGCEMTTFGITMGTRTRQAMNCERDWELLVFWIRKKKKTCDSSRSRHREKEETCPSGYKSPGVPWLGSSLGHQLRLFLCYCAGN